MRKRHLLAFSGLVLLAACQQEGVIEGNQIIRHVQIQARGQSEEAEVVFFRFNLDHIGGPSHEELEKEYARRSLRPVSPNILTQLNTDDPTFIHRHAIATHWKASDGSWCFATFGCWTGERLIDRYSIGDTWNGVWWFGGVPK